MQNTNNNSLLPNFDISSFFLKISSRSYEVSSTVFHLTNLMLSRGVLHCGGDGGGGDVLQV
jgi:hypothetical protein